MSNFREMTPQFSQNDSAIALEWLSEKNSNLLNINEIVYSLEAHDLEISNI